MCPAIAWLICHQKFSRFLARYRLHRTCKINAAEPELPYTSMYVTQGRELLEPNSWKPSSCKPAKSFAPDNGVLINHIYIHAKLGSSARPHGTTQFSQESGKNKLDPQPFFFLLRCRQAINISATPSVLINR